MMFAENKVERDGAASKESTPLELVRRELELHRKAESGQDTMQLPADVFLEKVVLDALDQRDAYYYSLFRKGELDDEDLAEYERHIKSGEYSRSTADPITKTPIDNQVNKEHFYKWLYFSLHPDVLEREQSSKKFTRLLYESGVDLSELRDINFENLTEEDLEYLHRLSSGEKRSLFKELRVRRRKLFDAWHDAFKERNIYEAEKIRQRLVFYNLLIIRAESGAIAIRKRMLPPFEEATFDDKSFLINEDREFYERARAGLVRKNDIQAKWKELARRIMEEEVSKEFKIGGEEGRDEESKNRLEVLERRLRFYHWLEGGL